MNANIEKTSSPAGSPKRERSILCSPLFILVVLVAAGIIGYKVFQSSPPADVASAPAESSAASNADNEELKPVVRQQKEKAPEWTGVVNRQAGPRANVPPVSQPTPTIQTPAPVSPEMAAATAGARQIITGLTQVDLARGELTEEQTQYMDQSLKQLVASGAAAVPAIREFLERNLDLSFEEVKGGKAVGYSSLRTGLLAALPQIGGPEALQLSLQVLQTTADPREIALLTQNLEQLAPGEHRQEALNAIRETLEQASKGDLGRRDVGPLFQVLQTLDDSTVISELEKSQPQWSYYATMTLAGLPDGAGVPALIGAIRDPSVAGTARGNFALQMLAQIAPMYPDAAAALLEQARANQLSERAWRQIATGLGGDQYQFTKQLADGSLPAQNLSGLKGFHIESGNQNFYSTPVAATWPAEQIHQRRELIDQLLALNSNPAAAQALKDVRASLVAAVAQK
jgi:hypothetical protein